ncbi:MAG: GxxExxY protein [Candidatus Uhrbacteria bacterium]
MEEKKDKLLYPKLSYQIIGVCFDVYNELGSDLKEKNYQKAIAFGFTQKGISFFQQKYCPIKFKTKRVGDHFVDFLVDEKIILEIKVAEKFKPADFKQVKSYLISNNIELGILVRFSGDGVAFCRVLKPYLNS